MSNIAHGMRLASERVIELMPEASAKDALIGVGILGDKMALLSGEPTDASRLASTSTSAQHSTDYSTSSRDDEGAARRLKAETGLDGENPEQNALRNGDTSSHAMLRMTQGRAVIGAEAVTPMSMMLKRCWRGFMNDGSAPWIKIITRIFEDAKIIALEQLPDGYGVLIIWFKLLTLAGEQNRGGSIYFTDNVPFTAELLAAKWRCKSALVQMALTAFQKFGMIGIDEEGTIWILDWSKYQNEEGLSSDSRP